MTDMYKKIKKQNGEAFAQALRNYHNGLLEIPDIDKLVRYAGRDATPLLSCLMSQLSANDDDAPSASPALAPKDPFVLLDQAGYDAFYADTLAAQNSIAHYFLPGELLCTFNDRARYQDYHIVHAVKKDVETVKRADFEGKEQRHDAYGTSVISIQMLKKGGFISIKNRYNHTVNGCDNTFNSNPDNIIKGLSVALKQHFSVDFTANDNALPENYTVMDYQIFHYHTEHNNIYYGDSVWARNGVIHEINNTAGDAMFDGFVFDNHSKTLKIIDDELADSFADDFNRCYGGNRGLSVQNGNLVLNGEVLIGAENSRITSVYLPGLTTLGYACLYSASALTQFKAPNLTTMGDYCFYDASALAQVEVPALTTMGDGCLRNADALTQFEAPILTTMGNECFYQAPALTQIEAPALITMGNGCFRNADALTRFEAPILTTMGNECFYQAPALTQVEAPALTAMGSKCFCCSRLLKEVSVPALTTMGSKCFFSAKVLTQLRVSALTTMGDECFYNVSAMTQIEAPALTTMGDECFHVAEALTQLRVTALTTMGDECFYVAGALTQLRAPALTTMGDECFYNVSAMTQIEAPALTTMGDECFHVAEALTQLRAPALTTMGDECFYNVSALTQFEAPALTAMGSKCFYWVKTLTQIEAPALTTMGNDCFYFANALTQLSAPALRYAPKRFIARHVTKSKALNQPRF